MVNPIRFDFWPASLLFDQILFLGLTFVLRASLIT